MTRRIDVAALVTGLILLGFAAISGWLLAGNDLIGEPAMWFATVLITAGIVGLVVSLRASKR